MGGLVTPEEIASLIAEYQPVFLYLEAMQESGITNMLSNWVKYFLRNEFNTLKKSSDTVYLCWVAFGAFRKEIEDIPTSRAFHRKMLTEK